ncbi:SPOR domain-containing protein [Thermodesulfobacteriota bacterium]
MNFKNRITAENLISTTNLVIAVCIITIFLILWKSFTEEKPVEKPVVSKQKKVVRVTVPREKKPPAPELTERPDLDSQGTTPENSDTGATSESSVAGTSAEASTANSDTSIKKTVELKAPEKKKMGASKNKPEEKKILSTKEQNFSKIKENIYKIVSGETLFDIAGKKEIYNDPLKWPSLYKHNMHELAKAGVIISDDLPHKALPGGLSLKFITAQEAKENAVKFLGKTFVVNVLSTRNEKTIVQPTVTLINRGFNAYVTSAVVKDKKWLRLRTGFYKDRQNALADSKKIMEQLHLDGAWVTKVEKDEFEKVVGY